jgi:hypothetical protein
MKRLKKKFHIFWPLVFLGANFCNLATKNRGWRIQQRDFWDLKKKIAIYWQKCLEVARFRQCVHVGWHN